MSDTASTNPNEVTADLERRMEALVAPIIASLEDAQGDIEILIRDVNEAVSMSYTDEAIEYLESIVEQLDEVINSDSLISYALSDAEQTAADLVRVLEHEITEIEQAVDDMEDREDA
mgnify:CR=1 FL=1